MGEGKILTFNGVSYMVCDGEMVPLLSGLHNIWNILFNNKCMSSWLHDNWRHKIVDIDDGYDVVGGYIYSNLNECLDNLMGE